MRRDLSRTRFNPLVAVLLVLNVILIMVILRMSSSSADASHSAGGASAALHHHRRDIVGDAEISDFVKAHERKSGGGGAEGGVDCRDWIGGSAFLSAARSVPAVSWSDKTSATFNIHSYETMYERILGAFKCLREHRGKKVKLFEIGIGPNGEVRSYQLYKAFLGADRLAYHALEYQNQTKEILANPRLTAEDKAHILRHLVIGDQSRTESLEAVWTRWGPFDVIVDDGSHYCPHQIYSFEHLFLEALVPGGTYIIEDLQTSYHPNWAGSAANQQKHATAVTMITDLVQGLHFHWWTNPTFNAELRENTYGQVMGDAAFKLRADILDWIQVIECDREICAIRKRLTKMERREHKRM